MRNISGELLEKKRFVCFWQAMWVKCRVHSWVFRDSLEKIFQYSFRMLTSNKFSSEMESLFPLRSRSWELRRKNWTMEITTHAATFPLKNQIGCLRISAWAYFNHIDSKLYTQIFRFGCMYAVSVVIMSLLNWISSLFNFVDSKFDLCTFRNIVVEKWCRIDFFYVDQADKTLSVYFVAAVNRIVILKSFKILSQFNFVIWNCKICL